jgi:hypothetical protein
MVPADLRVTIFVDIVLHHGPAPYSKMKTGSLVVWEPGFRFLEDGRFNGAEDRGTAAFGPWVGLCLCILHHHPAAANGMAGVLSFMDGG